MASCELNLFCTHETEEKELCSGYLYKSPPENRIKSKKSWKRRFFVLKKSKTSCQLEYYKNEEKRSPELLGVIDMSQVSVMLLCPETHSMWNWLHEHFRCSSACVLFMKVTHRDYFFIGENSWEVDKWFRSLFDALYDRPHKLLDPQDSGRIRDISAPPPSLNTDQGAGWTFDAYSVSEISQEPVYANISKCTK